MKIIVVSGAYQADTFYQVQENIELAKWAAIKLWKQYQLMPNMASH